MIWILVLIALAQTSTVLKPSIVTNKFNPPCFYITKVVSIKIFRSTALILFYKLIQTTCSFPSG